MNETESEPGSASELEAGFQPPTAELNLLPLPADLLPPPVRKLLAAPTPVKLMATKGMAALKPAELLLTVYQLSFDPDEAVKAAAFAAPVGLPDQVVALPLGEPLPREVLHFFATRLLPTRTQAIEKILYNREAADETFLVLAGRLRERELEIIFDNEQRILRYPAILQALYFNPHARMSSINRAIELCARNNVRIAGIPAYDEVVKSIREDPAALDPEIADQAFASVLEAAAKAASAADAAAEGEAAADGPLPAGATGDEKDERESTVIDFTKLKLYEKIRLATLGNEYCRQHLIRDPNRMVAMAAIRSPKITDSEIVRTAGHRGVCEDVIRYIANQREFVKMYQVKFNLVTNPKCPLALSLRMLPHLRAEDLKTLARSKNVPSALSNAARKLMQTRSPGGG